MCIPAVTAPLQKGILLDKVSGLMQLIAYITCEDFSLGSALPTKSVALNKQAICETTISLTMRINLN